MQRNGLVLCMGIAAVRSFTTSLTRSLRTIAWEKRKFTGPTAQDTVMTTWHDDETLEEALAFFITLALPTEGLIPNSNYRVTICVGNPAWAAKVKQSLESAEFLK